MGAEHNGKTRRRPRVLVVGAGFGGLRVAAQLRRAECDVVLVDRSNHHVFQPLLYQVATAALSPSDIAEPIRSILRRQTNITVRMAGRMGNERVTSRNLEVVRVEADSGLIYVKGAVPGHRNGIVRIRPTSKADL